jgi:PmbA protein
VGRGRRTSAKAYGGEIESYTSAESFGVGVRVVTDHRQGFAWAGTLDEGVVAETLQEARDNARFGEPDEFVGLADPDGVATTPIELWRPGVASFDKAAKIDLAIELERLVRAGDPRITGVRSATYGDSDGEAAVATSTGLCQWSQATFASLAVSALAADGEATRTGYGVGVGREPHELAVEAVATEAVERATAMIGARKIESGRMPIVVEARAAASILGLVGGMLTGNMVLKGRSPFADRLGDTIASPLLTLVDDPTDHRSLGADSHDGEGLATRRNLLVVAGVLQGFLHDTYSGRRSGAGSTGSAVRGYSSTPVAGVQVLAVEPGPQSTAELVAAVDHGLLVESWQGLHSGVNLVSGDFSVGVEGHLIRHGQLAEPVREVTVGTTLQRLLLDLTGVASELEWQPDGTGSAALAVSEVSVSGS